ALVAETAQALKIRSRSRQDTGHALNRLDQNRGHTLVQGGLDGLEVAERQDAMPRDVGPAELPVFREPRCRDGVGGAAMESAFEGEDAGAARGPARQAHGVLAGLGAG